MDKARAHQLIEYKNLAESLQNNPIMQSYFLQRKAALFDRFCKTPEKGDYDRKVIWREMKELDALEQHLHEHIDNGKIALQTLDEGEPTFNIHDIHKR